MTLLVVLLILWCMLHSLLITRTLRDWLARKGGIWSGVYRLAYVLFSLATFPPLLWYMNSLPQRKILEPSATVLLVQGILLLYACFMFLAGGRVYDMAHFLGIRQWRQYRGEKEPSEVSFVQAGILRYVRHPWYSGSIALLWSLQPLTDVTLVGRAVLTAYLVLGTLLEERKLRADLGEAYQAYCRKVPMLIPWKRPR